MRRIACARFREDSSRTGVPMLDSSFGMGSCLGTVGSGTLGLAMTGSCWIRSLVGCVALWGMLGSEASVSL